MFSGLSRKHGGGKGGPGQGWAWLTNTRQELVTDKACFGEDSWDPLLWAFPLEPHHRAIYLFALSHSCWLKETCQPLSFLLQSSSGCWAIVQDCALEDGCGKEATGERRQAGIWEVSLPRAGRLKMKGSFSPRLFHRPGRAQLPPHHFPVSTKGVFRWVTKPTHSSSSANPPSSDRISRREK